MMMEVISKTTRKTKNKSPTRKTKSTTYSLKNHLNPKQMAIKACSKPSISEDRRQMKRLKQNRI